VLVLTRTKWADVLVGSSDFEPERYALAVAGALREAGLRDAVLRPHPAESSAYYEELLAAAGVSLRVDASRPFGEALAEADLVISAFSTTNLEVMLRGKPLLCVNLTRGLDYAPPFDGRWGVPVIRDAAELSRRLARLVSDPAAEAAALTASYGRVLDAYVGPADGRAADRVLDALRGLARRGRAAPSKEIPA
jgi:CDP-glycerol glycerophosphotransferase (TagB/SpsB family)